jgi:hypothetical protein
MRPQVSGQSIVSSWNRSKSRVMLEGSQGHKMAAILGEFVLVWKVGSVLERVEMGHEP